MRTAVVDPMLEMIVAQQPDAESLEFQKRLVDRTAALFTEQHPPREVTA